MVAEVFMINFGAASTFLAQSRLSYLSTLIVEPVCSILPICSVTDCVAVSYLYIY
jgi:hypothetical protein